MKALVLALVLFAVQTVDAGAYVVCNATPRRAACLGPRIGTNYGWRGWYGPAWYGPAWYGPGWDRWRGPYAGPYGWRGPYAGPPGPYGWGGPYAGPPGPYFWSGGPYFRPGPYF
jgi:hypothetical protein